MSDYEYEVRETLREDLDLAFHSSDLSNSESLLKSIRALVHYINKIERLDSSSIDDFVDDFVKDYLQLVVQALHTHRRKIKNPIKKQIKQAFSAIDISYFEHFDIPQPKL
jgi:flagellar motor component MotA